MLSFIKIQGSKLKPHSRFQLLESDMESLLSGDWFDSRVSSLDLAQLVIFNCKHAHLDHCCIHGASGNTIVKCNFIT